MGRFWIDDEFIRSNSKKLRFSSIAVFVYLASRAGSDSTAYVGQRRIAEDLGMSLETANTAMKELIAFGFLERTKKVKNKVFGILVSSVRENRTIVFGKSVQKEYTGTIIKEEEFSGKGNKGEFSAAKEQLRTKWGLPK